MAEEPFLYSVTPVFKGTEMLIGRDDILKSISAAVLKNQNVSLIGDTKIGKTSVLKRIELSMRSDSGSAVIPVYIDFDKFTVDLSIETLLQWVLNEVYDYNEELKNKFSSYTAGKSHEFSKVVDYCTRHELILLLILDNFDQITVLRTLDADFWKFLRGNAIETGLSVITASRSRLETLCHKGDIAGSQFWNIFHPVLTLSIFQNPGDVLTLLSQGIVSNDMRELIAVYVGSHPCFLKVGANVVLEGKYGDEDPPGIIADAIYRELRPYYNKCFRLLAEDERNVDNGIAYKLEYLAALFALAGEDRQQIARYGPELENLEKLGYAVRKDGEFRIYSPLFSRYLKERQNEKIKVYGGDKPYIFISYAHEDRDTVLQEAEMLYKKGYRIWFDKEGIKGGEEWRNTLNNSLGACHTMLVFLSNHSIQSQYVCYEITKAVEGKKQIIPIHLKDVVLTPFLQDQLNNKQALNKHDMDYIERLIEAIHSDCKD